MDHIKEGLEKADEKLGTVVDGGKAEVDIGKENSNISDATRDIGRKMVELFDSGKTIDDEDVMALYKKIVDSRAKIEELKKQQEEYKKKL
jgi:hypothetical protein